MPLMVYGSSVLSAVARKKLSDKARELHASGVLKGAGKTGSKMSRQVQKSAAIAIASQALFFASAAVVKSFMRRVGVQPTLQIPAPREHKTRRQSGQRTRSQIPRRRFSASAQFEIRGEF